MSKEKDPIVFMLQNIPPYVCCDGYEFVFKILHESNEVKIGYFFLLTEVKYWVNPITNSDAHFLFLIENIEGIEALFTALKDCDVFLKEHGDLITH